MKNFQLQSQLQGSLYEAILNDIAEKESSINPLKKQYVPNKILIRYFIYTSFIFRKSFKFVLYVVTLSMRLYSHYGDIAKDIFLIVALGEYLRNSTLFFKWILASLIGSFCIPFILASINVALNPDVFNLPFGTIANFVIIIAVFPLLHFLLIIIENKTMMELENCHQSQVKTITTNLHEIRKLSANFVRTELGIENPLQLTFSILLLLFSISPTRISDGLEAIFDETSNENAPKMPFNIPPEALLFLTYIWTFFSAFNSYCKRMSWTKANFSLSAKATLFFYVSTSMLLTISTNIIFVTPSLGLLSTLRHYQGELSPYNVIVDPYNYYQWNGISINVTTDLCYFSDIQFPWSDLTRFNYTDRKNPIPPPLTIYTYFSLETILYGFWIIRFLHILIIWIVKRLSNPVSYKHQNYIEAFTNAAENCQIPAPMFDWDDLPATISEYVIKQRMVDYEMGFTIMANFGKHLLMMIPVWVFGKDY